MKKILLLLLLSLCINANEVTATYGSGSVPFLNFYQQVISPMRVGKHCPMYPSCSQYAKIQFTQNNPFSAYTLSVDRIIRCGRDHTHYPDTIIDFRKRLIDNPLAFHFHFEDLPPKEGKKYNTTPCNYSEGDFLYRSGFYELAVESYLKELNNCLSPKGILKASHAAYYSYDLPKFTKHIYALSSLSRDYKLDGELSLLIAKKYFEAKQYKHTLKLLAKYDTLYTDEKLKAESALLYDLNKLYLGEFNLQKQKSKSIDETSPLIPLKQRVDSINHAISQLNYRNKRAACMLSAVLPGSGYLVSKRRKTALFSFTMSALTIGSSVELYRNEKPITASLMALIASGLYFGSISGSRKAVEEYNKNLRISTIAPYLEDIEIGPER